MTAYREFWSRRQRALHAAVATSGSAVRCPNASRKSGRRTAPISNRFVRGLSAKSVRHIRYGRNPPQRRGAPITIASRLDTIVRNVPSNPVLDRTGRHATSTCRASRPRGPPVSLHLRQSCEQQLGFDCACWSMTAIRRARARTWQTGNGQLQPYEQASQVSPSARFGRMLLALINRAALLEGTNQ